MCTNEEYYSPKLCKVACWLLLTNLNVCAVVGRDATGRSRRGGVEVVLSLWILFRVHVFIVLPRGHGQQRIYSCCFLLPPPMNDSGIEPFERDEPSLLSPREDDAESSPLVNTTPTPAILSSSLSGIVEGWWCTVSGGCCSLWHRMDGWLLLLAIFG